MENAENLNVIQNCNSRNIKINKNYLNNYNNCEIKLLNVTLFNEKHTFSDKYFYPSRNYNQIFQKDITFQDIKIEIWKI